MPVCSIPVTELVLRLFDDEALIPEITALLHRAYAELGRMGLNYTAVDQSEATTLWRCREGETCLAVVGGAIVGTITLTPPDPDDDVVDYRAPNMAHFQQFGVEPAWQGKGIGRLFLDWAESRAAELGFERISCDTAEPAQHIVELYQRRGYMFSSYHQWEGKHYRSVILVKPLLKS